MKPAAAGNIENNTGPAVAMVDLSRRFGDQVAVDTVSATIAAGSVTALLGPNGSGKTTLMKMICGLIRPDSGYVSVFGQDIHQDPRLRTTIGYCPQKLCLWFDLTGLEQLDYLADMQAMAKVEKTRSISNLLSELGLVGREQTTAGKLSGGMQRRLHLALSLVHQPRLLVLDEPFNGLDAAGLRLARTVIVERAREQGTAVLLSTHVITDIERFADQVIILHQGRLIAVDTPAALIKRLSGQRRITVQVESPFTGTTEQISLLTELEQTAGEVQWKANTIFLTLPDIDPLPALIERFRHHGMIPGEITCRAPSLEDVYLSLTGDPLSHETDSTGAP